MAIESASRSSASTTTGPGVSAAATIGLLIARKAASSRETPIEKPVAGTGSLAEARDEPVVASAAADRAEADRRGPSSSLTSKVSSASKTGPV